MTDQQQRTTMEWIVVLGTTAALTISSWSLLTTHQHASRITALETQSDATETRIEEKFETLIDLNTRTNQDIRELKDEIRRVRESQP